jgi:hypothetical protein
VTATGAKIKHYLPSVQLVSVLAVCIFALAQPPRHSPRHQQQICLLIDSVLAHSWAR